MKVLIVGSGGREHAIAWSVAKSPKVDKIYCAPGNAGIAEFAECVNIKAMEFDKLVAFAKENAIDLTIIGMDDPLVGGVVDAFESEGLRVFGPRKNAAIIEGSKAFSKDLMKKYKIPTAAYENFTDPDEAIKYLETAKMPIVLKADGLALGKGVLICNTLEEAKEGVKTLKLVNKMVDDLDKLNKTMGCPPEILEKSWSKNMIWYGPGGIGASYTIPRYQEQHQLPFRNRLTDKKFNGHVCRFAEGNFACFFGWPNLTNRPLGGFLGMPGGQVKADMQVVDVYCREGDKLSENWVLIDLPYWLKQQGLDILERTQQIYNA